jgi:hypothetical protein
MTSRDQLALVSAAAVASVLVLLAGVAGHEQLVAYAAPVLVLVLPLLAGRYLGEERLARAVARVRHRRRRAAAAAPRSRAVVVRLPRGGRLIASGLAKRPPPVSALS